MRAVIDKVKSGYTLTLYENTKTTANGAFLFISGYQIFKNDEGDSIRIAIDVNGVYTGSIYPDSLIENI